MSQICWYPSKLSVIWLGINRKTLRWQRQCIILRSIPTIMVSCAFIGTIAWFIRSLQLRTFSCEWPSSRSFTEQLSITIRMLITKCSLLQTCASQCCTITLLADALETIRTLATIIKHLKLWVNDLAITLNSFLIKFRVSLRIWHVDTLETFINPNEVAWINVELTNYCPW